MGIVGLTALALVSFEFYDWGKSFPILLGAHHTKTIFLEHGLWVNPVFWMYPWAKKSSP
jgi:hypothetical protein